MVIDLILLIVPLAGIVLGIILLILISLSKSGN